HPVRPDPEARRPGALRPPPGGPGADLPAAQPGSARCRAGGAGRRPVQEGAGQGDHPDPDQQARPRAQPRRCPPGGDVRPGADHGRRPPPPRRGAGGVTGPVLAIVGPTAAGKTALSLEVAEALDAEVVSMDSAMVYRGMDIGTDKPSLSEVARVRHHLVDVVPPS